MQPLPRKEDDALPPLKTTSLIVCTIVQILGIKKGDQLNTKSPYDLLMTYQGFDAKGVSRFFFIFFIYHHNSFWKLFHDRLQCILEIAGHMLWPVPHIVILNAQLLNCVARS